MALQDLLTELRELLEAAKPGAVHHWKTGDFKKSKDGTWQEVPGKSRDQGPAEKPKAATKPLKDPAAYSDGVAPGEYAATEFKNEYLSNPSTRAQYPEAFRNQGEFVAAFTKAVSEPARDFSKVQNTDAAEQKKGDYDALFNKLWGYKGDDWTEKAGGDKKQGRKDYHEYLKKLLKTMAEDPSKLAPPIIGVHRDAEGAETEVLIAGNSRAMMYAYLGVDAPVRRVPLKGPKLPPPSDADMKSLDKDWTDDREFRKAVDKLVSSHKAKHLPGKAS